MKVWVLMKIDKPIRVYFDEQRANDDYALVTSIRSDTDYFGLYGVECFGSDEIINTVEDVTS